MHPVDHCCGSFDCVDSSYYRCDAMTTSVRICLSASSAKSCKFYDDKYAKPMTLGDRTFELAVSSSITQQAPL